MKVLMLGWEFPPLMTGGLGTATEGIVSGLRELGHEVWLVLPSYMFELDLPGLHVMSPEILAGQTLGRLKDRDDLFAYSHIRKLLRSGAFESHYISLPGLDLRNSLAQRESVFARLQGIERRRRPRETDALTGPSMFTTIDEKMAALAVLSELLLKTHHFDVVHGHDWVTYPALAFLKKKHKLPAVAHVHSTEFDRAGAGGNSRIIEIERLGMNAADIVIAVSDFTKKGIQRDFGIEPWKVHVAHNAVEKAFGPRPRIVAGTPAAGAKVTKASDPTFVPREVRRRPVITFLGRVTFQKGPEYFVRTARIMLDKMPELQFRVAGTGDQMGYVRGLVSELKMQEHFEFTGFLDPAGVEACLRSSDLLIVPSVSEPFGIVVLEAIRAGVPVILTKQSGAAEVVQSVIKADFWDTHLMAERGLAILRNEKLRQELIRNANLDLDKLTWTGNAIRCVRAYEEAVRR